jgi:hypothetical protein
LENKRSIKKPTATKRRKLIAQTHAVIVQGIGYGSFAIPQPFIHSFITASGIERFVLGALGPIQNLAVAFDHFSPHRIHIFRVISDWPRQHATAEQERFAANDSCSFVSIRG